MLTVKDLQKKLKIGRDTAYALMHAKGFPSIKIGGRYFVTEEALIKWLRAHESKSFAL